MVIAFVDNVFDVIVPVAVRNAAVLAPVVVRDLVLICFGFVREVAFIALA